MTRKDRFPRGTSNQSGENRGSARHPHSIRFSDSEWDLIEQAAARHAVPAGELVRSGAPALAEDRLGEHPPATLSPGHIALIEAIYRAVHMLTMLNTEQMSQEDFDELVGAAHGAMADTMNEGPA